MRLSVPLIAAVGALGLLADGCSKPAPLTDAPTPSASASGAPAGPIADTAAFRAELKAPGPFKKGDVATFVIRVEAKAPYHVNDEYPAKFKVTDAADVVYFEPKLERNKHVDAFGTEPCAGSAKEACVLNITVRFTPKASGTVRLGGTVDVGVCNKDQCLIEKKPLDVSVTVS